ncbi:MAG: ABC transporter permease [Lachnospiraceae bacterium]|nr:ABC transporter permease [Lachnospiraceae bacterium]
MINMVKMDLYKLYKSKCTWVILGAFVAFISMVFYTTNIAQGEQAESVNELRELITDYSICSEFEFIITGDIIALFGCVFALMYMHIDKKDGYIKNIWGCIAKKSDYLMSKMVIMAIYNLILFVVAFTLSGAVSVIHEHKVEWGFSRNILIFTALQFMLSFALECIAILIQAVIGNMVASVAIVCGYLFLGAHMIYTVIDHLVEMVFKVEEFATEKYTLYGNLALVTTEADVRLYTRALIVGCVFLLATYAASVFRYRRMEL